MSAEENTWDSGIRRRPSCSQAIFLLSVMKYQALKQVPKLTKLLGVGEKWTPMTKEDIAIIEALSGKERVVKHSEGYIVGSKVTITNGPLMGMEAMIRRIDRHKRMAWMEIEIFGRKTEIQAGLEIIRKE